MKKRILASMLIFSILLSCFFTIKSNASELAITVGLASSGTALLGLLGLSGVGMELENNKKFIDLSEEEKTRLENGLAQNFEEVALQRGASLEKIKNWTTDLCNGVLDKASECWDIFKDWAKNIELTNTGKNPALDYPIGEVPLRVVFPFNVTNKKGVTTICNYDGVTQSYFDNIDNKYSMIYVFYTYDGLHNCYLRVCGVNKTENGKYKIDGYSTTYYGSNGSIGGWSSSSTTVDNISVNANNGGFVKCYGNADIEITINGVTQNGNYVDTESVGSSYFKTNTDYLERLRGTDTVEVIDVTDIKNPIIETIPNTKAEIDFNRGTKRPSNKNDDDDKIVGGLVPADVWYQSLDDYVEQQNNAIVEYDNYINENPEDKDKYFIATSPITNIHNYYNTLPVINIPSGGTVVNNYYEYNNYNNNNVTIYELPYNSELVPLLPTLFFENKFPFCIPWDIYSFINIFRSEAVAPHFEIPYPYMDENGLQTYTLVIDLSEYNYVSNIFRVMFFILFIVGLMILTRNLIKG